MTHARGSSETQKSGGREGYFEETFTPRAQFQLLTLFVWFGALALLVVGMKVGSLSGYFSF